MKLKHWVVLLLLLSLIWMACSSLKSGSSQTRDGISSAANATSEMLFEQGKSYKVKPLKECDTSLQLFDFERDARTGEIVGQFTVPPDLFCKIDKPFTVIGEPQSGLVPQSGIRGALGQLKVVRFVRIRWETDVREFYQEAFVEEAKARKDSEPIQSQ